LPLHLARVILVRLYEWLDELSWDDPHSVADLAQLSRHPLRTRARLHTDQRLWSRRKEGEEGVT
jgi:hypothetical protein